MMPTVDAGGQGVALIVLEEDKKNIKGLKILTNGNANFSISRNDFEKLIDNKRIDFADQLLPSMQEDIYQTYLRNQK